MCRLICLLILLIAIIYGCDSTEPTISVPTDEITLKNKGQGFSFSKGSVVSYPNSQNIIPDIEVHANRSGTTILGVFLTRVDSFNTTFNLIDEFDNSDSALIFFSNLNEVPDSNYLNFAMPVNVNQIWAVKTYDNKFGKILVMDTEAYLDTAGPPLFRSYYAEITFKWKYQSNGSRYF